ncbi:hypothetical protein BXZ70DRAFT_445549 [Cristinia sonorae]|uniref:RanBP2-type domain-containing protein n=1 Tax=Cristinia sonorae TaxID=1940300 RepID=A0A8K0UHY2_9AGAR|nr:hypothetical protein BXZ70DRAFT_445549 [Cristinia sonorae]
MIYHFATSCQVGAVSLLPSAEKFHQIRSSRTYLIPSPTLQESSCSDMHHLRLRPEERHDEREDESSWTCGVCTLMNQPLRVACGAGSLEEKHFLGKLVCSTLAAYGYGAMCLKQFFQLSGGLRILVRLSNYQLANWMSWTATVLASFAHLRSWPHYHQQTIEQNPGLKLCMY